MAIPTVNELALTMMREFGEDTANSGLVSKFEEWIKDVFDEIGVQTEWQYRYLIETLNTINGIRVYTFTGLQDQILTLQYADTKSIIIIKPRREIMELGLDLGLLGKPVYAYIENFDGTNEQYSIGFQPVPNATYAINVLALLQPQELSSNTKLPFSRKFLFLLKDGVRFRLKISDKDYNAADRFEQKFQRNLSVLKAEDTINKGEYKRMLIQDIPSGRDDLVKLPPDHFQN